MRQTTDTFRPTLSSRKILLITTIGLLCVIASATAFANRSTSDKAQPKPSVQTDTTTHSQQDAVSENVPATGDSLSSQPADNGDSVSSGATNNNYSSTSVTVNGQTTEVSGDTSLEKSYTTDDGNGSTTEVDISVQNNSSSSTGTDDMRQEIDELRRLDRLQRHDRREGVVE